MSPELYDMLISELLPGVLTLVAGVVGAFLGRKGWKGYIGKRILEEVIEEVVEYLNKNDVPRLKAQTQVDDPARGFDLTPSQAREVMYKAKGEVIEKVKERAAERGVPAVIPPIIELHNKIESVVQTKKLPEPIRKIKGFR